jgi:NTE family protein
MKQVGLALGGGAARGLAHIGVLRALRLKRRYLPSVVAGTSAGSIIASLYAAGMAQTEMEAITKEFDWFRHVFNFGDTLRNYFENKRGGLVSNEKLGRIINELIEGRQFSDLSIGLAVTASDIESGRRVIFTSPETADLIDREVIEQFLPAQAAGKPGCETLIISDCPDIGLAVRASCAVPGVFLPVEIQGMRLLDGGLLDQVPVDIVRAMGAGFVIGVSLSMPMVAHKITSTPAVLSSLAGIMSLQQVRKNLDHADIGFQVTGAGERSLIDPHQYDLIDIGFKDMIHWIHEYEKQHPLKKILLQKRA